MGSNDLNIASSLFYNLLEKMREAVKGKVDQAIRQVIKSLAIAFAGIIILFLGLFHLSTGAVRYFTVVFGGEVAAYSVVGIFLVLIAIILFLVAMPRR